MIPATSRLPLRSLKNFFRQSLRTDRGIFSSFVQENKVGSPRFVVSISKKAIRLATQRNKVKRRIYSQYIQMNHVKPVDVVVRVKNSSILQYEDSQISTQLHELLDSAYSRLPVSSDVSG